MIEFLSDWIEQITISIIIVTIIELIIPRGNFKKYINVVLGMYVIFSIISPFVDSSALYQFKNIDFNEYVSSYQNEEKQVNIDSQLEDLYIDELKNNIDSKVQEYGFKLYSCSIDANLNTSSENARNT